MSIENGSQLGAYTVVGPLGAGGMGEVYRATDTKLDREVAIKVLPESMAHDPERVARFEREAKVLAQLNHPMIAAIHGFDEANGKRFLVLELVEGPTLAERLDGGRLPVEECLDIARQIAEALEVAHEKGIIHRDLKPANVKVTAAGEVKVLDFGLAKALAEEDTSVNPANSPTITKDFTAPGVILGTAAYMSPEQARGRTVDKRSDIWSFGCVLYECLTGDSMFRGETVTDTIGAILHKQPDWEKLPSDTPKPIRLLLERCLSKEHRRRWRDIGDARIELESVLSAPQAEVEGLRAANPVEGSTSAVSLRPWVRFAFAVSLGVVVTLLLHRFYPLGPATSPEVVVRKFNPNLSGATFWGSRPATISPDGKKVVYDRDDAIELLELSQLFPRELIKLDFWKPFWSPSSDELGYFADGHLWRLDLTNVVPKQIAKLPHGFRRSQNSGAAWLDDGRIVFTSGSQQSVGLWEVFEGGGNPHLILKPNAEDKDFESPSALPNSMGVIFAVESREGNSDRIAAFVNGERKSLFHEPGEELRTPVYSTSGHIIYNRETGTPGIWAVKFSLETLRTVGVPFLISQGIQPSTSTDGSLLYVEPVERDRRLVWIDEYGSLETIEPASKIRLPMGARFRLAIHADGNRVLVPILDRANRMGAIWLVDLKAGTQTRVTDSREGVIDSNPAWHPDGKQVLFKRSTLADNQATLMTIQLGDAPSNAKPLIDDLTFPAAVTVFTLNFSISPEGDYLAYDFPQSDRDGKGNIAVVPLDGSGQSRILRDTNESERSPNVSPDGRLLSFVNSSGEFVLTRFPSGKGEWQVPIAQSGRRSGALASSFWGTNTDEMVLYCIDDSEMHRVPVKFDEVELEPVIDKLKIDTLCDLQKLGLAPPAYMPPVLSPTGNKLLLAQPFDYDQASGEDINGQRAIMVENWFAEFEDQSE